MAVELALPTTETLITGDDLLAMGDIGPCELVEGRIVLMSPAGFPHGDYEMNFGERLKAYARQSRSGKVVVGEVGIYVQRDPDTIRAADVIFVSNERLAKRQKTSGYLDVAPDLIVEILSPDDRWQEVTQKMREYFAIGVRLIWIAEPASKTVFAYKSLTDVREFGEGDTLAANDVLPGFAAPVAALFEE
ncbi:MAG: Uma2 family endonuclease [Chloroflexi bacterium]|nr:Uma2 family endonuclease [Chloroflexota bacterium]